ncbi:MAG: acetylglutamate kinase [Candidatus Altiarchaeota archaeon]|nr:acetylglutamate kinase [Candidatus Altiarchaeota archaeon]
MSNTRLLIDALTYMKNFRGQLFVVKMGSEVTSKKEVLDAVAADLILLDFLGIHPVVVHGGGIEITEEMNKRGKIPKFVKGLRVTDRETIQIVKTVFKKINDRIVAAIETAGGKAAGLPKEGEILFQSEKKKAEVDIGYVGDIKRIREKTIRASIKKGSIPVVSPVGRSPKGYDLNINADTAASELAAALKARKIIFLTDVAGVLDQEKKLIKTLTTNQAQQLIDDKIASGGMIPKLKACKRALDKNVTSAHIIKAGGHALLEEILTKEGTGTMIAK